MRKLGILTFVVSAAVMCTNPPQQLSQSVSGTWNGEIEDLGLALVLHLGDTCTADSPDQGAYGLKASAVMTGENGIKVTFKDIHATYKAELQGDSLIGKFSQMGIRKRLAMSRGDLVRLRPQTPEPPFPYATRDVTFDNGDVSLAGTLTLAGQTDVPVLVMVTGSGPQNRDEELMGHKAFAVIADALARGNIATLRYDDRGCGKSGGDYNAATTIDFLSDAQAAVRYLRARGYSRVGLLGHSEGGTIAFLAAGAETPDDGTPDFIVSLAGMVDRGDSTLFRQIERMLVLQGAPESAARLGARISAKQMFKQKNAWMDCFRNLEPAPYVARVKCPFLALGGSLDYQVIPEYNLNRISALCPSADVRLYPGLNHLFQHCRTGLSSEYSHIEETFSPEVLSDICAWVNAL